MKTLSEYIKENKNFKIHNPLSYRPGELQVFEYTFEPIPPFTILDVLNMNVKLKF